MRSRELRSLLILLCNPAPRLRIVGVDRDGVSSGRTVSLLAWGRCCLPESPAKCGKETRVVLPMANLAGAFLPVLSLRVEKGELGSRLETQFSAVKSQVS